MYDDEQAFATATIKDEVSKDYTKTAVKLPSLKLITS